MKQLNYRRLARFSLILVAVFAAALPPAVFSAAAQDPPPPGSPVLSFTVSTTDSIVFNSLTAAEAGTPVWIQTAPDSYEKRFIDKAEVPFKILSKTGLLKIYGKVTGADLAVNDEKITAGRAVNHLTLFQLSVNDNQMTELTVENCPELRYLDVFSNRLTRFEVKNCPKLLDLYCFDNPLDDCALDSLFISLPRRDDEMPVVFIKEGELTCPGTTGCRDTIATNKGWRVQDNGDPFEGTIPPSDIRNTVYGCAQTAEAALVSGGRPGLSLHPNPATDRVYVTADDDIADLRIIALDGREIRRITPTAGTAAAFGVEDLPAGRYLLLVTLASGESAVEKLVVRK